MTARDIRSTIQRLCFRRSWPAIQAWAASEVVDLHAEIEAILEQIKEDMI